MKSTKSAKPKFTIQYRSGGQWYNGNSFATKAEAEAYAKRSGQDYQIVKSR